MKRIITMLLVLTLAFTLIACDDTTEASKPVLSGVDPVTINVGDDFDPKSGVKAMDEEDGDITANIKIEGTVNVDRAGSYELIYTIENSAKESAMRKRVITVLGLAGLSNGDFEDGKAGWDTWFNDSQDVDVEYTFTDNKATIDIKEQSLVMDNNWWDVQLSQKTIQLGKLESFTLKFKVSAENARRMMINVQGGGLTEKPINEHVVSITTEEQEVSIDFFAKSEAVDAELQFSFGAFHKVDGVPVEEHAVIGKVFMSDIRIVKGPELENQAPTLVAPDVLLRPGTEQFLVKQGVVVDDDRDALTLDDVTVEDITVGEKFATPAVKGTYQIKYTVEDSQGLTAEVIREIVVADAFELSNFSQVQPNGVPVGWEAWNEDTRGGIEVSTANNVATVSITKIGDGENLGGFWENQFKHLGLAVFKGKYTLTFTAKADIPRPVKVGIEGNGGVGYDNLSKMFDLTDEWATYTFEMDEVMKDATLANRNVQFWFGNLADEEGYDETANVLTDVHFKDVMVYEGLDVNDNWVDHADGTNTFTKEGTSVVVDYNKPLGTEWTTASQDFSSLTENYNTFTIHLSGTQGKQVLVKVNDTVEVWVTFDENGMGSATISATEITTVHLFAEGGVAPVTGKYIIESATLSYIMPQTGELQMDVNSNFVDNGDDVYTITDEADGTVKVVYDKGLNEWSALKQEFTAIHGSYNTLTMELTGTAGKSIMFKPNDASEETHTFDEDGKLTFTVTRAAFQSIVMIVEPGTAGATGEFIIVSTVLSYVEPVVVEPELDVNSNWVDNGDSTYVITEETNDTVKVVYTKGATHSYTAMKQTFTSAHAGYNTLTMELTGTAGKSIILKPNNSEATEQTLTFDEHGKISYIQTLSLFETMIIMVEPGVVDVTGEFIIVSAIFSNAE